ncbi:MAG: hypothetical protein M3Y05_05625 [Gemmatimonadota bacterium]|nr:hypothetical protein [Gemmatimonadota bacterium]
MVTARRARELALLTCLAMPMTLLACGSDASGPGEVTRSYLMGFSNFPPAPDVDLQRRAVEMWSSRADIAIMHIDPPWVALLAGGDADSLVRADVLPLKLAYTSIGKLVVIETDVTNGLDRTAESPALVALGRSITEDTVQKLYRRYVASVASIAHPLFLGLASETNLIRAASSPAVYAAVVKMTNDAFPQVEISDGPVIYVSVQGEVAWGRLGIGGAAGFVGIDRDLADFPFTQVLGISSYPYLGGFTDPSDVPLDYYSRIAGTSNLRVMVTEGGWSSANIGAVHSSPALQQAWVKRAAELLQHAHAFAWFQLQFTDINLAAFGIPADDPQVAPFARIGLVDTALAPKPALSTWDEVFARRVSLGQ